MYELSNPDRTAIALTFDDGPNTEYTPRILALLAHYDIRATFVVVGQNTADNPSVLARIYEAGHQIANHTWSHPDLRRLSSGGVRDELERTSDVVEWATGGCRTRWFRAPGGDFSPKALDACFQLGMSPLAWSVDPQDWRCPGQNYITSTVLSTVKPGAIILNHDGGGNRAQTLAALHDYIPRLLDAGYTFTTP
ncbi:polysaccharide deacetylase family protein [Streptomyces sp. RKAG337]|uniref:polysaccharide deacetylase family protein n=1 Tax=Streptomyces sp. RKAG337 TaxID=2893404 RepID=UPI0020338C09|nr:polysaccharide deacetylase family protein [Streptomyces sp. RKAG337]MCM2428691.1 polysaccharide deacetylase family protein [Streptomyces sp. RKAG337]